MIRFEEEPIQAVPTQPQPLAKIKVLGVGGAGCNIVNSMLTAKNPNIQYIVANTDAQVLQLSKADSKIQLGLKLTKGLGAGANPEVGRKAAEEDLENIIELIGDSDIVFLTGGMGGGTGSGAISIIAKALREKDILTIAIVTRPFTFEGKRRAKIADQAIVELKTYVDTLLVLPNQKLLELSGEMVSMLDAFSMINNTLDQSVRSISDIITNPGHINVDFADLRTIMKDMGMAVMGTGRASGQDRARVATLQAITSPLLENISIKGARSVLLNIIGGPNLGIHEINQAASIIYEQASEEANIILGSVINHELSEEIIVTIVATGLSEEQQIVACKIDLQPPLAMTTPPQEQAPSISAAIPAQEEMVEVPQISVAAPEPIDLNDLDVPAFMRKQALENQNTE
jgi:cell division protein FtsZ